MAQAHTPTVHRHTAAAFPVNAYLIESADGVVVVDSTCTVSDGRALRTRVDALEKPLLAVLITHTHPDHYGGLTELVAELEVPIIATAGVAESIRRDDPVKEQILRPMFGDEWPHTRIFPNRTIADGESVTFGGLRFTVMDLGPGESPHDIATEDGPAVVSQKPDAAASGTWGAHVISSGRLAARVHHNIRQCGPRCRLG